MINEPTTQMELTSFNFIQAGNEVKTRTSVKTVVKVPTLLFQLVIGELPFSCCRVCVCIRMLGVGGCGCVLHVKCDVVLLLQESETTVCV